MNIIITSTNVLGETDIISSKSELHRLLILSALCECGRNTKILFNGEPSQDVVATIKCLKAIGAKIIKKGNSYIVTSIEKLPTSAVNVCPNESGSTLRFILPVFSALGINYNVTVKGRLGKRPLSPLYELMTAGGVTMSENGVYPLRVSGKFSLNEMEIDGSVSSQFISGLLMSLPVLGGGSVKVTGDFQSKPYVDITVGLMRLFGVKVTEQDNVYIVKGNYLSPSKVTAGGDWSNGAFLLSLGAIAGNITVNGLDIDSFQGDKAIVEILKRFGANVLVNGNSITAERKELRGIEIDASNIPDLVPTIAIVASVSKGETRIYNAGRLRLKESDRIKSVVAMVNSLGGSATETDDGMIIMGREFLIGGVVDSFNDHRIVMSAAVSSAVCVVPVSIKNANAVDKSYPQFFEVVNKLGLKYEEKK